METYKAKVALSKADFIRINTLFEIDDISKYTNNCVQYKVYDIEEIHFEKLFSVSFDDGSYLTYDVCSGLYNYYDNVVWVGANGKEAVLDCEYQLDTHIEYSINDNIYIIDIELI